MKNNIVILKKRKPKYIYPCRVLFALFIVLRITFIVLNICGIYLNEQFVPQYVIMLFIDAIILACGVFSINIKYKYIKPILLCLSAIILILLSTTAINNDTGRKVFVIDNPNNKSCPIIAVENKSLFYAENRFYIGKGIFMKDTGTSVDIKYGYYYIFDDYKINFSDNSAALNYKTSENGDYIEINIPIK